MHLKQNGQEILDVNNKIYKKLFGGFGFVIIVSLLTLFVMSQTYIQNLVYHERLSQMEEVTHQMFRNLEDVIDTHWDEVDVQCNYLYYTPLKTDTDLYRYLKKLPELSNYHEKQVELIAVDTAGYYYTEYGRMGLLRGMNYLESAPERVSYISNSLTKDDSWMVFLEQLSTPITLQSGEKEITLRYFGISQSMTQLNDYFRCDAYENSNSVYVLDNNGFKLFNANDTELLKGHNVYTVLSRMSYLHGSSFAEAKERLTRTGSCYSNAVLDGTEYFYALKQMENAQWTLAFLVPAEYVAVNTQKLVNIVMVIIIVIAMMFSVITVFVGWFLLRQKQQQELRTEKEANLRLEQYNIHLTQVNDELRQAQVVAAEALQSAERASKAKTDFLSNMSHDIRTPMNAIIGITTLMKNELHQPEKLAEHLGKLESSGTNKVQGTGLGMAITKSIVDLMGGSIGVESATGKGTRFEVVLEFPIDAEADHAQQVQALPEEAEETSPLCGMKFLCAEDNAINAEILEMLLEAKGASCTICSNGQEIVDAFASVKPGDYDMILMDVQMPVMDGLEATRRIRSGENPLGRIIPILAMTANAFLEDMQKSRKAGMDEHLSKPVDIAALEQTIKRFRVTPPRK